MEYPLSLLSNLTLKTNTKLSVTKITEGIIRLNQISSCEESEEDRCSYEEVTEDRLLMLIQYSIIRLSFNSHIQTIQREKKHIKRLIIIGEQWFKPAAKPQRDIIC